MSARNQSFRVPAARDAMAYRPDPEPPRPDLTWVGLLGVAVSGILSVLLLRFVNMLCVGWV